MEELSCYECNEFKPIKKCAIIRKTNGKCFFAYLIKISDDYAIGYRLFRDNWVLFKLNLDEIDVMKPYNPSCDCSCQFGMTSIVLLACF